MPSWRSQFDESVVEFKNKRYVEALELLNKAIEGGADRANVFDLRASILWEHMKKPKEALKDAKMVIKLAPGSYRGYFTACQIFSGQSKIDNALQMASLALERTSTTDPKHIGPRTNLAALRDTLEKRQCHVKFLPLELLQTIFAYATYIPPEESRLSAMSGIMAETTDNSTVLSLSSVNRHWRSAALSHVQLWRYLSVTGPKAHKKAQLWGQRSRGLVEEVYFDALSEIELQRTLEELQLWVKAAPSIIRFCDKETTAKAVPILCRLWPDIRPKEIAPLSKNLYETCNSSDIRSVVLQGLYPWLPGPLTPALRFLKITQSGPIVSSMDPDLFLDWIREVPLETLVLDAIIPTYSVGSSILPRCMAGLPSIDEPLQSLRQASVRAPAPMGAANWFRNLKMPQLETLHLISWLKVGEDLNILIGVNSTGDTCRLFRLRHLRLVGCDFYSRDLVEALEDLNDSLEVLEISKHSGEGINEVVSALGGVRPRSYEATPARNALAFFVLCPKVREFDFSSSLRLRGAAVKSLVKSRVSATPRALTSSQPIHALNLDGCPEMPVELLPWLRSHIPRVSCVYETAKQIRKNRR